MPDLLDGPADARHHLILAHGAGEGPDSPFLTHIARALAAGFGGQVGAPGSIRAACAAPALGASG